jgi:hypothetical protein
MVLTAHQKAKHFTCQVCTKKLNSVAGTTSPCCLPLTTGLQNHLKTIHGQTLETVMNALSNRSNPATIPEISGMDGIPAQDLQEFKSRLHQSPSHANIPSKQMKLFKPDATVKKAKIDAPLDPETIQAQLAEFQKKKADQEIQELVKQGIIFPPGLSPQQALQIFSFRNPPPGTGPFAAKPLSELILTPATVSASIPKNTFMDGKLETPALPSQSNVSFNSASSPKFTSKSVFSKIRGANLLDLRLHQVSNLLNTIRYYLFRHRHRDLLPLVRSLRINL